MKVEHNMTLYLLFTYFTKFQYFSQVFFRKYKCPGDHWLQKVPHRVDLRKLWSTIGFYHTHSQGLINSLVYILLN